MRWFQATIETRPEQEELIIGFLLIRGFDQVEVNNPRGFFASLEKNSDSWDYLDDNLKHPDDILLVRFFLPPGQSLLQAEEVRRDLLELPELWPQYNWDNLDVIFREIDDQDWLNTWRKYYRPFAVGERLLVQPKWLPQEDTERLVLRLEPGLAFGSGDHATTRLCLLALEKYLPTAARLADIGTGSGILAIAGVLLGAAEVTAVDNDEAALEVARQNCGDNNCLKQVRLLKGDLADQLNGSFDLICANIVADPILRLIPNLNKHLLPGGYFLASGIIKERFEEVFEMLLAYDFTIIEKMEEGSWVALVAKL